MYNSLWLSDDSTGYHEDYFNEYNSEKEDSDCIDSDTEVLLFSELHHKKNELIESEELLPKLDCLVKTETLNPSTNDYKDTHLPETLDISFAKINNLTDHSVLNNVLSKSKIDDDDVKLSDSRSDKSVQSDIIILNSSGTENNNKVNQLNESQTSNHKASRRNSTSESDNDSVICLDCNTDLIFNVSDSLGNTVDLSLNENMQDEGSWNVDLADEYKSVRQSIRYHSNLNVICRNCHQRGHFTKSCPQPRKLPRCYLCSNEGHKGDSCPKATRLCSLCLQHHSTRKCHILPDLLNNEPCYTCNMIGHKQQECPNNWRRFHKTIKSNKIVQHESERNKRIFCFNCGFKGHHGHHCNRRRIEQWTFFSWPFVVCPDASCRGVGHHRLIDYTNRRLNKRGEVHELTTEVSNMSFQEDLRSEKRLPDTKKIENYERFQVKYQEKFQINRPQSLLVTKTKKKNSKMKLKKIISSPIEQPKFSKKNNIKYLKNDLVNYSLPKNISLSEPHYPRNIPNDSFNSSKKKNMFTIADWKGLKKRKKLKKGNLMYLPGNSF